MALQPVESGLEVASGLVVIRLQLLESLAGLLLPRLVGIVQVPLVAQSNDALVVRARNDGLLGLLVQLGLFLLDHLGLDLLLDVLDLLVGVWAHDQDLERREIESSELVLVLYATFAELTPS